MTLKTMLSTFLLSLLCISEVSAKYWVAIAAYNAGVEDPFHNTKDRSYSPAGHAYIAFIKEDPIGRQTLIDQAWGFYTTDGTGLLKPVPGVLKSEINRYMSGDYDNLYKSEVSYEHYNKAFERIQQWKTKRPLYALNVQTCVDFIKYVAAVLPEIKMPSPMEWRKQWPKDFVVALKNANHVAGQSMAPKLEHTPAQNLSEGAALMFSKTKAFSTEIEYDKAKLIKNPLTTDQMNTIFNDTRWRVSSNKKGFIVDEQCDPNEPMVELLDLNSDGRMEVAVFYGGVCLAGNTATGFILYTSNATGNYYRCLADVGILSPLKSRTNGYLDILLGGPGFQFPIYKWNGKKYIMKGYSK